MSRDIRFRAWFKRKNQMIYSPMAICDGWVLITAWIEGMDCNKAVYGLPEFEIMQFTGLADRNGKDIYEGDIIKIDHNDSSFIITWDDDGFYRKYVASEGGIAGIEAETCKVIGNIYENSDLLESRNDA